jgi:LysM repeat protein
MKWKDSDDPGHMSEEPDKEFSAEEEETSGWPDGSKSGQRSILSVKSAKLSPIILGVGLFAAALVLAALLFPRFRSGSQEGRIVALEARLQEIEDRLDKFDMIDDKVSRIWEQAKSFEGFKERFDRSEASMSLRMDHLASSLDTQQKQIEAAEKRIPAAKTSASAPKSAVAKPAAEVKKAIYHTVKAQETLYSISKQYGLKFEELLRFNGMSADAVIHPGQKLIIDPGR